MKKKPNDLLIGIICLLFSLFYLVNALSIKVFAGDGATFISSRTIPMMWGILMSCLSLRLIWRGWKEYAHTSAEPGERRTPGVWWKENHTVVITLALLLGYVVGLYSAGFLISTALYLFLQILILTPRGKARPVLTAVLSIVVTACVYGLFVYALHVPLPAGWLKY